MNINFKLRIMLRNHLSLSFAWLSAAPRHTESMLLSALGLHDNWGWRLEVGDFHFGGPASFVYAPGPSGLTPSDSPVWRGRATSNQEGDVVTLASVYWSLRSKSCKIFKKILQIYFFPFFPRLPSRPFSKRLRFMYLFPSAAFFYFIMILFIDSNGH